MAYRQIDIERIGNGASRKKLTNIGYFTIAHITNPHIVTSTIL